MDAECKKVSNLINGNSKKRIELLERENHLVVFFFNWALKDFFVRLVLGILLRLEIEK